MATTVGTLSVNVQAETRALVTGLNKASVAVRGFSAKVQGYMQANAQAMVTAGKQSMMMGAAMGVGIGMGVKAFASLEQAMATATAVSDVTEDQLQQMTGMATEMSKKWGVSAADTAQAFYFLGSAGLKVQEQIAAFPAVTTMAKAAMMDMGSAAEIVVDTMKGFKIPFDDTTRVTDILTKAVTSSNMTFTQLGESMSYVSGVARTSNMTLEETSAVLGLMANVGIKGSMAGTALRRALINLSAPSSEASKTLKDLGVKVYDDSGKMKSLTVILADLVPKLQKAGDETSNMAMKQLFGARAITGMTELVYQGAEGLRKFTKELEESGGSVEDVATKQIDTLTGSFHKLGQQTAALARAFGEDLAPGIDKAVVKMTELLAKMEKMPAPTRKLIQGTAMLTAGLLLTLGAASFLLGKWTLMIASGSLFAITMLKIKAAAIISAKAIATAATAVAGFFSAIGLLTIGGAALILTIDKYTQKAEALKMTTEATDEALQFSYKWFNKLNKGFEDGTLTGAQYTRGLRHLNTGLKEMGRLPVFMPKWIAEIIKARRETDKLNDSLDKNKRTKRDLLTEMIGAFGWKPPAMAMGMASPGGFGTPALAGNIGMGSGATGRGTMVLNLQVNVENAREAGRKVEQAITELGVTRD